MTDPEVTDPGFCHLHVHSEYSLIDGAIRIKDLIGRVKQLGHKAVAITDHGNLFGAVEFYTTATGAGIKPIIGAEIYHQPIADETKALHDNLPEGEPPPGYSHLVLLAKNNQGYKNLIKIVSAGYEGEDKETPSTPRSVLQDFAGDLIALSACAYGELGFLVRRLRHLVGRNGVLWEEDNPKTADVRQAIRTYFAYIGEWFGKDNFYVELSDNNLPGQQQLVQDLVAIAQKFEQPLVATCDAHYLNESYKEAHTALLGIKHGLTFPKVRTRRKNARFHVLDNEEMQALYGGFDQALANTAKIADQCDVTFEFGKFYLPKFETGTDESSEESLRRMSHEMLDERFEQLSKVYGPEFDDAAKQSYRDRLNFELDIIGKMGFPGYFLIVQDFINWAKRHDIPVGPGRGSGAGSLVAYALRITDLDPIPYNLVFERFLNPERVSMPDFDVDFCQDRRDEVIQYVNEHYGRGNVAQITTFGKMLAKAAVRDVGRVLDLGYTRVDGIAKLIPNELGITLKEALEREPRLREEAERDDNVAKLLHLAQQIEGLCRHTSVHAAGIVISDGPMDNYVPVYKVEGEEGQITQFEMKNAEKVGLVKFDFLGLKTLTVIDKAVKLIRQSLDPQFDIDLISMADKKVFEEVSKAHTVGIFQLESQGMQQLLLKLRPDCFEDVIAVVALFRPGPLGSGMVDDFIERKHGRQKIEYPVPQLEESLQETYGIILYQEQVMKIAGTLASYSLGEADLLRRAMGKKKAEEMAKQKTRFVEGCLKNNIAQEKAEEIFELMAKFAAYGFNKSHSAAYGLVSYHTAYLKTHFPDQFMAAIMTCDLDNTDKIVRYVGECRRLGITILPPCINNSALGFSVPEAGVIRFGLEAIKGIGESALQRILDGRREDGPYASLTDFAKRVPLHKVGKKTMELLVIVGGLDSFGPSRADLLGQVAALVKFSEQHHEAKSQGQRGLFEQMEEAGGEEAGEQPWDLLPPKKEDARLPLRALRQEKQLLGFYLSGHPLDYYLADQKICGAMTLADLGKLSKPTEFKVLAILAGVSERLTKTGSRMAYIHLMDHSASLEAPMFERDLPDQFPPTDIPVLVSGKAEKSFDGTTIRLRINQVKAMEEERRKRVRGSQIRLRADTEKSAKKLVQDLKQLCETHRGQSAVKVILQFEEAEVKVTLPEYCLDLSDEFLLKLQELEGIAKEPIRYFT